MTDDKYRVNRGKCGSLPIKDNIQSKITELLDHSTAKRKRTLATRIDIRYPESYNAPADNSDISKVMAKFVQKNKRKGVDTDYAWSREQKASGNQHYHVATLEDGQKVRSGFRVKKEIEALWASTLGVDVTGCVHYCNKSKNGEKLENGIMLDRAKPKEFDNTFGSVHHQFSYLSKEEGKGQPNDGIRDFGMSRLKKD